MSTVFDVMPGIDTPVGKVVSTLADIWEVNREESAGAPSAFRASQMNLVIHFGLGTGAEEARARFDEAVRFAQRYPCRILVLCPIADAPEVEIRAKVFAECYVGRSRHEMACCEAIILSYSKESRGYLESLVSTLVESDLPSYYWPHHFCEGRRIQDYLFFIQAARRVIVDSSVDGEQVLSMPWPRVESVRDLVFARLLPVRQVLGQFLAGFREAALVEGLSEVRVACCPQRVPEGRVVLRWLRERLEACASSSGVALPKSVAFSLPETAPDTCEHFEIRLSYANGGHITWSADLKSRRAEVVADFSGGQVQLTSSVSLLAPEAALAEALFF